MGRNLIDEVPIVRDEENGSFVFRQCRFQGLTELVIEMIGRLVEDEEIARFLSKDCEEELRELPT